MAAAAVWAAAVAAGSADAAPPRGDPGGSDAGRAERTAGRKGERAVTQVGLRPGEERPWKGSRIPYHTATPHSAVIVRRAAAAWNRADVGVRFVPASHMKARLIIRPAPRSWRCRSGATVGPPPIRLRTVRTVVINAAEVLLGEHCRSHQTRLVAAAHELGHVLGLRHERRRCGLMLPHGEMGYLSLRRPPQCSQAQWETVLCHLVTPADVSAARRLYGKRGGSAPRAQSGDCLHSPAAASNPPFLSPLGWAAIGLMGAVVLLGLAGLLRR